MRKIRQILGLLMMLVGLTAVSPLYAQTPANSHNFSLQAVGPDGQSVVPYFVLDGTVGGQISGQIYVRNRGNSPGSVQLYSVDAVTGQTGGTVLKMREDAQMGTGGWIKLEQNVVTLAPDEGQMISFEVNVPAGARSGQHVGGIVMEPVEESAAVQSENQTGVSFQVDVKTRTAVGVQINLPGTPVEQLEVLGIALGGHDSRQMLYLHLRNSGNQMVKTSGSLHILDAQGQNVQNIRFNIDTFLPDEEIRYPVNIVEAALPAGSYTADLSLRYGESVQMYRGQLAFSISEADNIQIFEGQAALASPVTAQAAVVNGRSTWQIVGIGVLAVLLCGFVIYLINSIYRYEKERSLRKQKLAYQQALHQQPVPQPQLVRHRQPQRTRGR